MTNNMLMFSPHFSTRHGFFNPFTPRNLSLNLPEMNETHNGLEDYGNLPKKTPKSNINGSEINYRMDKLIQDLRFNISHIPIHNLPSTLQHKIHKPQPDHDNVNKALNLDINLINDTYLPSNQSNIPTSIVPMKVNIINNLMNCTKQMTPRVKKPFSELALSPN